MCCIRQVIGSDTPCVPARVCVTAKYTARIDIETTLLVSVLEAWQPDSRCSPAQDVHFNLIIRARINTVRNAVLEYIFLGPLRIVDPAAEDIQNAGYRGYTAQVLRATTERKRGE